MRIENIAGCELLKKEESVDDVLVVYCAKHFLSSRPWLYAMLLFLQSELIERAEKNPLIFPKEKTRGLNALNFNFLLSFLVFLGFWLCVCSQRSGLCRTSPRLHAQKVRQKRLPVSIPVHYPTAKAGRLSACPP